MFLKHIGLDPVTGLWLEILVSSLLVVIAGTKLSRYGDVIGEKTGLGGAWVGLILLSAATSLPELVTCIGTVGFVGQPDLAFGNLFGSNCFNLLIIVLLDLMAGKRSLFRNLDQRHVVPAGFGILLMGMAAAPIVLPPEAAKWNWIGSMGMVVVYMISMRVIFEAEKQAMLEAEAVTPNYEDQTLKPVLIKFGISAGLIVGAGLWLSFLADDLADTPIFGVTLGRTFIGTLLLALVTSLPEVVVTVTCFRLGALGMAMGNLLGSNIFNMLMVPVCHAMYGADIYGKAKSIHIVTAMAAMFMTALVIIGLGMRSRRRFLGLNYEVIAILLTYVACLFLVYQFSSGM